MLSENVTSRHCKTSAQKQFLSLTSCHFVTNALICLHACLLVVLQDSFRSTEPFGFAASYHFVSMSANVGTVLASLFFGSLSDKIGRRPCILTCLYVGAVGSVLKFLARDNYWMFCAANFFTGLFAGALSVGIAYVSDDVTQDRTAKDAEIGRIYATNMVGRTGGGIIAILMQKSGLFRPLLISAGISIASGVLCHIWLIEPNCEPSNSELVKEDFETQRIEFGDITGDTSTGTSRDLAKSETETQNCHIASVDESTIGSGDDSTTALDKKALWNVIAGNLADNLGTMGLVPFCLTPLMFDTYYADFVKHGLEPIMTSETYKWIYVFVALLVIPGAAVAPHMFRRYGPATSCVGANLLTGLVTVGLLQIATINPPTIASFAIFAAVLYVTFPATVISQLSTGPMLDRIAPPDQRGAIQGYNTATMNLAAAVGPFLYGILTDATSIDVCLYTATALSVAAAVINSPLVLDPRFGPEVETLRPSR